MIVLTKLFSQILTRKHRHLLLCLGVLGVIAATIKALTIYLIVPILGFFGQPTTFDVTSISPHHCTFYEIFRQRCTRMFITIVSAYLLKLHSCACFVREELNHHKIRRNFIANVRCQYETTLSKFYQI